MAVVPRTSVQPRIRGNQTVDRRQKALHFLNQEGRGLEIGPSYNPLVTKASGARIETVDHTDRETLVAKYTAWGLPSDKVDAIESVDHIWAGGSLLDVIPERGAYDYIIASHFLEHTVDLVSFLNDCEALLNDGGRLSLVLPDKRYCFDRFQPLSSLGDAVDAFYGANKFHTAGALLDHQAYACKRDEQLVWSTAATGALGTQFPQLENAADVIKSGLAQDEYHDTHHWKFTPSSFDLLAHDLAALGFHDFAPVGSFPTDGFEFFVTLGKGEDWPAVDRITQLTIIEEELTEPLHTGEAARLRAVNAALAADTLRLQRELDGLRAEAEALRASTSWRVTAPIRTLVDLVRRLRRR
jgi:hypothetical protein